MTSFLYVCHHDIISNSVCVCVCFAAVDANRRRDGAV